MEKDASKTKEKKSVEILLTDFPNTNEFIYEPNLELYESIKRNTPRSKND
jgi:hypothetical protein